MHICEICKKKTATIHLTDIHEDEKRELHICQECAEAKGIALKQTISLPDLLSGLSKSVTRPPEDDPVCDHCGLRFSEFQSRGRLGCSRDYSAFRKDLMPMLERIHGKTKHVGKSPRDGEQSALQKEIGALQRRMREAVDREAYEEAAALRDELNTLRKKREEEFRA
jgi:protein arginine kinase activator